MVSSILRCKTRTEHSGQFTCISLHFDFIETSSLRERIRAGRHFVHMLCKMASRQRGVCVKHPKRCKTSNLYFCEPAFFQTSWNPFSQFRRKSYQGETRLSHLAGAHGILDLPCATKLRSWMGYQGWSPWRTCSTFFIFIRGYRLSQEPARRIIGRPRFGLDGKVASSKDVEKILSLCVSPLVTK